MQTFSTLLDLYKTFRQVFKQAKNKQIIHQAFLCHTLFISKPVKVSEIFDPDVPTKHSQLLTSIHSKIIMWASDFQKIRCFINLKAIQLIIDGNLMERWQKNVQQLCQLARAQHKFKTGPLKCIDLYLSQDLASYSTQLQQFISGIQILELRHLGCWGEVGIFGHLISQSLKNFNNLSSLSLNIKSGQTEEIVLLIQALKQVHNISDLCLDIPGAQIGDIEVADLVVVISRSRSLKTLRLGFFDTKISSLGIYYILNSIYRLDTLSLNLGSNKIEQTSQIASQIYSFTSLLDLTLVFDGCNIGEHGFNMVMNAISNLRQLKNLALGFEQCSLTDKALHCLPKAFKKLNCLVDLAINFSNNSFFSINLIGEGITKIKNLQKLNINLSHNEVGGLGLLLFLTEHVQKIKNLTYLSLLSTDNELSPEQAYNFGQGLASIPTLISLTLSLAGQAPEVATQLSQGIICSKLSFLDLNLERMLSDEQASALSINLRQLKNLKWLVLNLPQNLIGIPGAYSLLKTFTDHKVTSLKYFEMDLNNNLISRQFKQIIIDYLNGLPSKPDITLRFNYQLDSNQQN